MEANTDLEAVNSLLSLRKRSYKPSENGRSIKTNVISSTLQYFDEGSNGESPVSTFLQFVYLFKVSIVKERREGRSQIKLFGYQDLKDLLM